MGLFDKKECSICGGQIGLLGNKKLKDGNMCKDCAGKLSVWFQDRSESTVADINNQLSIRKAYADMLSKNFIVSRAYGEFGCILIDEADGIFVALPDTSDSFFGSAKVVTSIDQIRDKNPDVLMFRDVVGVDINVTVTSGEDKQTVDGKQVSYNPRHMVYMVQFSVTIRIKGHPFIKTMTVPLNNGAIHIRNMGERMEAEYNSPDYAYGFKIDRATNWEQIQEYQRFLSMAEEIKSVLENY